MGLRQLLTAVIPGADIVAYDNAGELKADNPDRFFHFFVDIGELLANRPFFLERQRRTIVLVNSSEQQASLADFHCLCVTDGPGEERRHEKMEDVLERRKAEIEHGREMRQFDRRRLKRKLSEDVKEWKAEEARAKSEEEGLNADGE